MARRTGMTVEEYLTVMEMILAGLSVREVGIQFHRHESTISCFGHRLQQTGYVVDTPMTGRTRKT
jgi:transposase